MSQQSPARDDKNSLPDGVKGPDISNLNAAFHFYYDQARRAHCDGDNDKPLVPPLREAGACLILAQGPEYPCDKVELAERGLELYEKVEKITAAEGPHREYITAALDRARRVLALTQEHLARSIAEDEARGPMSEEELAKMRSDMVERYCEAEGWFLPEEENAAHLEGSGNDDSDSDSVTDGLDNTQLDDTQLDNMASQSSVSTVTMAGDESKASAATTDESQTVLMGERPVYTLLGWPSDDEDFQPSMPFRTPSNNRVSPTHWRGVRQDQDNLTEDLARKCSSVLASQCPILC
ncbi:uncharacterized protein B0I36DRAFT_434491 [Microdochium trichocladiopsis]|uniref:Uncharacterized protein n=1 Tax=Microdochium trichocladiopsis TaxID=1682393 RepID=A0A9P9BJ58_9PEZI|nr:uncharacterized protein B0I36DRAFT_434491 [Microdochium trichocladiopsis]KAH7024923.1 hypothetical protein B0I36DRAFT_434491 [Microdochium trichocladiopsis]